MSSTIVLAGGSGFLGVSFAKYLQKKGIRVVILTRGNSRTDEGIEFVHWDGKTLGDWAHNLDGAKSVINFTGKSVNCIYTQKNKEEILSSRLDSVAVIDQAILQCTIPPESLIQAGSLAIYGNTEKVCDEEAPSGEGFSADVCVQWENAFFKQDLPNTRKVLFRIGFVLGKEEGALVPLKKLTKFGLGGTVGSGRQYISWLHVDDLNELLWTSIQSKSMKGIYNATGPTPVTNKVFMETLRKVMNRPWSPPTPAPLVKVGAYLFMKTEPELALTGRNCIPKRLEEEGFQFTHTHLEKTLQLLV
ncbi:TIGR01777 family oxidoreductase [Bacillus carboniphilus]|uniref:TIGR01777 family oxidoreductase n=1 Tax=Bacillus carboniphilus TaxID=86663 RepID=A0ABN0W3J5_9BACI